MVAHGGAEPGFLAYFARLRDDHLSFIVLTNSRPCEPDKVLWKVAAVWLSGVDQALQRSSQSNQPGFLVQKK